MTYRQITKGFMFSAAFVAMMAAYDGKAQTASSNSSSTSASGSASESSSTSGAAAIVNSTGNRANQRQDQRLNANNTTNTGVTLNQTSTSPDTLRTNNNSVGQFSNTQSGHTSSDVTVRTTPMVYAPPVSGGNPCTLAVSGGVSVIGWGASAGGTFVDQDCANRQKIAMVHNAGYRGAAKELMCDDRGTYMAFKTAGEPCAFRAAFEPQGAAPRPVQIAPQPPVYAPPPPMAAKEYPRCNPRLGIVDNCVSG